MYIVVVELVGTNTHYYSDQAHYINFHAHVGYFKCHIKLKWIVKEGFNTN